MKAEEEYQKNLKSYLDITKETSGRLTALSLAVIAAIYVFIHSQLSVNVFSLKLSLVFYFATASIEIIRGFLKSHHYAMWIDGKIDTIDRKESCCGIIADYLFYLSFLIFVVATILFGIGIFK